MTAAAPEGVEHAYEIIDRDAQRQSAADAYLSPVLGRANLDAVPDVTVDRLCIADGRCTAASYIAQSGMKTYVEAAQVVLAAGAIGSPHPDLQVLITESGIGILPGLSGADAGFGMYAAVMQPFSRGTVRLSGPVVDAGLLIDPNYFGDGREMHAVLTGLRLIRKIRVSPNELSNARQPEARGPRTIRAHGATA